MVDYAKVNASVLRSFGVPITYTRATGGSLAITGALSSGDAIEGSGAEYRVFMRTADFSGILPAKGDSIAVELVTYRVVDVGQPDEGGGITLSLRKAT